MTCPYASSGCNGPKEGECAGLCTMRDSIQPADPDAKPGPALPPLDIDLDEMRRQMDRERARDIALVVMVAGLVLMWGTLLVSMTR